MAPSRTLVVSDTNARTGLTVFAFTVVADAVFTTCTGIEGTSGITFPAGTTVFGNISAVTLASGTVTLYFR